MSDTEAHHTPPSMTHMDFDSSGGGIHPLRDDAVASEPGSGFGPIAPPQSAVPPLSQHTLTRAESAHTGRPLSGRSTSGGRPKGGQYKVWEAARDMEGGGGSMTFRGSGSDVVSGSGADEQSHGSPPLTASAAHFTSDPAIAPFRPRDASSPTYDDFMMQQSATSAAPYPHPPVPPPVGDVLQREESRSTEAPISSASFSSQPLPGGAGGPMPYRYWGSSQLGLSGSSEPAAMPPSQTATAADSSVPPSFDDFELALREDDSPFMWKHRPPHEREMRSPPPYHETHEPIGDSLVDEPMSTGSQSFHPSSSPHEQLFQSPFLPGPVRASSSPHSPNLPPTPSASGGPASSPFEADDWRGPGRLPEHLFPATLSDVGGSRGGWRGGRRGGRGQRQMRGMKGLSRVVWTDPEGERHLEGDPLSAIDTFVMVPAATAGAGAGAGGGEPGGGEEAGRMWRAVQLPPSFSSSLSRPAPAGPSSSRALGGLPSRGSDLSREPSQGSHEPAATTPQGSSPMSSPGAAEGPGFAFVPRGDVQRVISELQTCGKTYKDRVRVLQDEADVLLSALSRMHRLHVQKEKNVKQLTRDADYWRTRCATLITHGAIPPPPTRPRPMPRGGGAPTTDHPPPDEVPQQQRYPGGPQRPGRPPYHSPQGRGGSFPLPFEGRGRGRGPFGVARGDRPFSHLRPPRGTRGVSTPTSRPPPPMHAPQHPQPQPYGPQGFGGSQPEDLQSLLSEPLQTSVHPAMGTAQAQGQRSQRPPPEWRGSSHVTYADYPSQPSQPSPTPSPHMQPPTKSSQASVSSAHDAMTRSGALHAAASAPPPSGAQHQQQQRHQHHNQHQQQHEPPGATTMRQEGVPDVRLVTMEFEAGTEVELSVQRGDWVEVRDRHPTGWTWGRKVWPESGLWGWFPEEVTGNQQHHQQQGQH
ncbi:unnamed protein product [Vitrella brassicaformis CCMP3155]|uniref:SH3 domain-containing protein n=2 Tax=Vitrella brassicaformis TaxID=1169539 RepID=A0A0G4EXU9_VITBC|nr:unnamed protein product [Vitrella brassicaformis CCMP3155]|eukprot:CEM03643.1 unnamed protein product [Vitrella brassicaformis CCMP3155]